MTICVRLDRKDTLTFRGRCLARVAALNHDDSVRRQFCVYSCDNEFVAERVDNPGTIDIRFWGAKCSDSTGLYEFFGNEPLANYLYGILQLEVPGLRCFPPEK